MRGPKGSEIELTIGRPGESQPFSVTLIRDTIKVASVRKRWLEPGYGYIRIAQFQQSTGEDVSKALNKLHDKEKLKGLVLDLRNNPGGVSARQCRRGRPVLERRHRSSIPRAACRIQICTLTRNRAMLPTVHRSSC